MNLTMEAKPKKQKKLHNLIELERAMGRLVRQGYDAEAIASRLQSSDFQLSDELARSPDALAALVNEYLTSYKDFPLIQRIVQSTILHPLNRRRWIIYDEDTMAEFTIDGTDHLYRLMDREVVLSKVKSCEVIYNPRSNKILNESGPMATFNSYRPPAWKYKHFFEQEKLPVVEAAPELYMRFIKHLCDNDEGSVEFLLDWLAISLQSRNLTYLCTVGSEGIGKGLLGQIISRLHGEENSATIKFNSIVKQFNSMVANKTFIYLDEVNKVKPEEYDMLKRLNDSTMEVERKYQEAESNVNYSNIYLSSNHLDSIQVGIKDRRMSIIQLTDTRFEHSGFSKPEITQLLTDDNLLSQFASYLFYRKFNTENITFAYKSKRALEMLDATTLDWQRSFLDEVCKKYAGKTIKAADAVALINHFAGRTRPANVLALSALSKKLPGVFESKKMGEYQILEYPLPSTITGAIWVPGPKTRVQCIKILPLAEQKSYDIDSDDNDNVANYA